MTLKQNIYLFVSFVVFLTEQFYFPQCRAAMLKIELQAFGVADEFFRVDGEMRQFSAYFGNLEGELTRPVLLAESLLLSLFLKLFGIFPHCSLSGYKGLPWTARASGSFLNFQNQSKYCFLTVFGP